MVVRCACVVYLSSTSSSNSDSQADYKAALKAPSILVVSLPYIINISMHEQFVHVVMEVGVAHKAGAPVCRKVTAHAAGVA